MKLNLRTALFAAISVIALFITNAAAFGSTIDVVFYDNRFGTIDDTTGTFNQLSTLPISASSGIASMGGMLFIEDMGSKLFTVDPITGAYTLVGNTGLNVTSGAFAGDENGLFEVDYASNLQQIDPLTGHGSLIAATGLVANNGHYDTSLSAFGNSLYYTAGVAGASDELYQIDMMTGHTTDLGSTGVTGIAGSAIANGELELFQYGQSRNYVYMAAIGTNTFTRGAQLSATIVDGGAIYVPGTVSGYSTAVVPEPATGYTSASLLIIGIAIVNCRRLRLRKVTASRASGMRRA